MLTFEDSQCQNYLSTIELAVNDDEFVSKTNQFINTFVNKDKNYIMKFKMLPAKARKGICSNQIYLLPASYPRVNVNYELLEAILMLVNTICYNYGSIRNELGEYVNCDSNGLTYKLDNTTGEMKQTKISTVTFGGMCFELPDLFISQQWKYYTLNNSQDEFVKFDAGNYKTDESFNIDEYAKYITPYNQTFAQNINPVTLIGTMKYVNPTRIFTYQILNDEPDPTERFTFDKLGAKLSDSFRYSILPNLWKSLHDIEEFRNYAIINSKNSLLFNSFDFIVFSPEGYEIADKISPTAQFVYKYVLEQSMRWNLVFPIENTMSMAKINAKTYDMNKTIVQDIWTYETGEVVDDSTVSQVETKTLTDSLSVKLGEGIPEDLNIDMKVLVGSEG